MAETGIVERVARAICRAIVEKDTAEAQFAYESGPVSHEGRRERPQLDIDIEGEIRESWQEFIPVARAAIEAMREPTEEMVKAGWSALDEHRLHESRGNLTSECVAEGFASMIDAALSPKG